MAWSPAMPACSSKSHRPISARKILYTFSQVSDLAVLSAHRGHGLGRALIAACEGIARADGQRWIRLGVLAANQDARRFYARSGFSEMWLTLEKALS